jgi:hypothetical protein
MSIANLFRLGRLWIEHFGQLRQNRCTVNIIIYYYDPDFLRLYMYSNLLRQKALHVH